MAQELTHRNHLPAFSSMRHRLDQMLEEPAEAKPRGKSRPQPGAHLDDLTASELMTSRLSQPGISHVLVAAGAGRLPQGVVTALDLLRAVAR